MNPRTQDSRGLHRQILPHERRGSAGGGSWCWGHPSGEWDAGGNPSCSPLKCRKILESGNSLPVVLLACLYDLNLSLRTTDRITGSGRAGARWDSATGSRKEKDSLPGPELPLSAGCFNSAGKSKASSVFCHLWPSPKLFSTRLKHTWGILKGSSRISRYG